MHTLSSQLRSDGVAPELELLIGELAAASKTISAKVRQGALAGVLGSAGHENVQGETQKKLDVIANDVLKQTLGRLAQVRALASEEEDHPVPCHVDGAYLVAFDPLDGSSNIDINGQIGTIFTVYPARDDVPALSPEQFAQSGRAQVCAGYVLYGPSTQLVLTTGGPVRLYTLAQDGGFVLTQEALRIEPECSEFAVNLVNFRHWPAPVQAYIQKLQAGVDGPRGRDFNMRWNGAMVGDVHRVLMRGGIFLYPANTQSRVHNGKLRLLYEAHPMALLVENAGGRASDGHGDILDRVADQLHQRVPVVLGAASEVQLVVETLAQG